MVGFLSRHRSGKGPHLALRGVSLGVSRVAAVKLQFLSSYDGDLRNPLVLPKERPVSMRVLKPLSGFLCFWSCVLGPHLKLKSELQCWEPA